MGFPGGDFYTRMTRDCLTIHGSNCKSHHCKPKLSAFPAQPALGRDPGATGTVRKDRGIVVKPKKTVSGFNLSLLENILLLQIWKQPMSMGTCHQDP